VVVDLTRLVQAARARMEGADPSIVGLRPAPADWMTENERRELERLWTELPTFGEEREAARKRVASKRAERVKAWRAFSPDEVS
jgi:hypothetical protein